MEARKNIINDSPDNWVNNNRHLLLPYKGMWVAHDYNTVVASAKAGSDLMAIIKEKGLESSTIVYIYPTWFQPSAVRFLPIRFKTFKKHEWIPNCDVIIANKKTEMLVDSGADMCLIPHWLGLELGLSVSVGEPIYQAHGIGGSVDYVIRNLTYTIQGVEIRNVPTAWIQNPEVEDIILGREVVFDAFDIEFKQAEEMIIFKKRESVN